jgi:hypothetical protein
LVDENQGKSHHHLKNGVAGREPPRRWGRSGAQKAFAGGAALEKGTVKAEILYAESDGVWLHLERENRRSVEVRVATIFSSKKSLGKKHNRLAD